MHLRFIGRFLGELSENFVGDALRMYGYTVLQTTDPREALRWAREHSGPIHLLVSDVVMPLMHGPTWRRSFAPFVPASR